MLGIVFTVTAVPQCDALRSAGDQERLVCSQAVPSAGAVRGTGRPRVRRHLPRAAVGQRQLPAVRRMIDGRRQHASAATCQHVPNVEWA